MNMSREKYALPYELSARPCYGIAYGQGCTYTAGVKVNVHIQAIAAERGITTSYQLWQKIGGSQESAAQLWRGEFKMIGLNTLAKLCAALDCQPGDLFTYEAGDETKRRAKAAKKR